VCTANRHLHPKGERNGVQRRTKVIFGKPRCEHWSYCGWRKATSRDEATLNSKEIKPIAIAIIELRLPEGISQSVGRSVSQLVSQQKNLFNWKFLKFHNNLMRWFRVDLKTFFGLGYT